MSRAKTTSMIAPNKCKPWSDADRRTLLDLIARKVPRLEIARILGRTFHAVEQEINIHHREAWQASGHPEARRVTPPAPTEQVLVRLEAKVDSLGSMLRVLLDALGETKSEEPPEAPNGRAHP